MTSLRPAFIAAALFASGLVVQAVDQPTVTIEKPRAVTVSGGRCLLRPDGTFGGVWGPGALPTLAFTIGPGSTMADQMHASKTKYTGPGRYPDVIVAVYLGKDALEDSYMGLGAVVIAADGHSGTFTRNNGSAAGRFDCGVSPAAR